MGSNPIHSERILLKQYILVWVAQLVEQRIENPWVNGSSPFSDNFLWILKRLFFFSKILFI